MHVDLKSKLRITMRKLSVCLLIILSAFVRQTSAERSLYEIDMFLEESSSKLGGGKGTKGPKKESKTKAPGTLKKYVKLAKDSKSTKNSKHDMHLHRYSIMPSLAPSAAPTVADRQALTPMNGPTTSSPTSAPTRAAVNSQQQVVPTRAASRTPTFTRTVTIELEEFEICFNLPSAPSSPDVDEVASIIASYLNDFFQEYVPYLTRLETKEASRSIYQMDEPFCINFEATAAFEQPGSNNIMDENGLTHILTLALGNGFLPSIQNSLEESNIFYTVDEIFISDHLGPTVEESHSESSSKSGIVASVAIGGALVVFAVSLLVHRRKKRVSHSLYGRKSGELSLADDTHAETFYTSAASLSGTSLHQTRKDHNQFLNPHSEEDEAQGYHAGDGVNCIDFEDEDSGEESQCEEEHEADSNEFELGSVGDESRSEDASHTIGERKGSLENREAVIDWANNASIHGSELFPSSLFDDMTDEKVVREGRREENSSNPSVLEEAQQSVAADVPKSSQKEQQETQTIDSNDEPGAWPTLQSRIESLRAYASGTATPSRGVKRQDSDENKSFLPPSLQPSSADCRETSKSMPSERHTEIGVHGNWSSVFQDRIAKFSRSNSSSTAPTSHAKKNNDREHDTISEGEDEHVPMRVIDLIHKFN